jgi:hypothetical protein
MAATKKTPKPSGNFPSLREINTATLLLIKWLMENQSTNTTNEQTVSPTPSVNGQSAREIKN